MQSWQKKKLSSVTLKIGSGATPKGGSEGYKTEGISLIRSMNVHDGIFIERNLAFIDDSQAGKLSNVEIQKNDVLLNITGASIARCCTVPEKVLPARVNQHVSIIRPNGDFLDNRFLCYLLISNQNKAALLQTGNKAGSTREALTKAQLENFEISFPSISEQKRIVTILDQVFSDIEQARAKTEKNVKNARELFESYLQQVFGHRSEGWPVKKVSEIAETCLGKMLDKSKNKGEPRPYLRNLNVQWFDINTTDLLEMRFETSEYERYAIKKGDLVICEGGYPGRGAIWNRDENIFFQKALHRVRSYKGVYNRWILYYLYFCDCNGSLKRNFTGAGIQHFTGTALKKLSLPVPQADVAGRYVERFDLVLEKVQQLEEVYNAKLIQLDELKKSIFQKAFAGQLTNKKIKKVAA